MSIYFIILLFLLWLQGKAIQNKKKYLTIAFWELVFISGFRVIDKEGSDTRYYCDLFIELSNLNFESIVMTYQHEVGFYLFCHCLSYISKDPQILLLVSSIIINLPVVVFVYRKSKDPCMSILLYITLLFFFGGMNLMRFSMALSILLMATDYVVNRKFLKFSLVVFFASLFHFSAYFFFLIYFIYPFRLSITKIVLISLPFIGASFAFNSLFSLLILVNARYASYDNGFGEFYQSAIANYLLFFVIFVFAVFALRQIPKKIEYIEGHEKYYIWCIILAVIMSIMAINIMMITRFVIMFSIMEIIYIPNLLKNMKNRKNARLYKKIILTGSFLQMFVVLQFRPDWYFINPYQNTFIEAVFDTFFTF